MNRERERCISCGCLKERHGSHYPQIGQKPYNTPEVFEQCFGAKHGFCPDKTVFGDDEIKAKDYEVCKGWETFESLVKKARKKK